MVALMVESDCSTALTQSPTTDTLFLAFRPPLPLLLPRLRKPFQQHMVSLKCSMVLFVLLLWA